MIRKIIITIFFSLAFTQYYDVQLNSTGESHLIIFQDSITGLEPGDEIGVFDLNGVIQTAEPGQAAEYGEVLVGAGTWVGEQVEVVAIMSLDLSQFNGPVLNGAVDGNDIVIRAFDASEQLEVETELTINTGGQFGDLFTVVSELTFVAAEPILGCTDELACNYDSEANTDDGSCDYPEENYDCDGNCTLEIDCAGECGGSAIEDCTGDCNGNAEFDDCGVCDGDGSSCEVYIELELTTTLDEPIEDEEELQEFEEDFESYMEVELGLPGGTVEVTSIEFSESREVEVTIEFTVTLTEDELAETDFDPETAEEDIESSVSDVEEEIDEGLPEFIEGCTDESADNYDSGANVDDGSCEYPAQAPDEFFFYQSTLQAFYYIYDANIEGEPLEIGADFIAIFNGDICVGNYVWEGPAGPGLLTTVPAMGDDGEDYTQGYMGVGDNPTFKIYDASEGIIYDASPETSADLGWANFGFYDVDVLNGVLELTVSYSFDMHYGANLVSFHALPEDVSLASVMESLGDAVTGVIGEGVAASPNPVLGWVGSLSEIERTSGYWIKLDQAASLELIDAIPTDPSIVYNMHYGANLISFPIAGSVSLGDGIPDDVEQYFTGVIGEGVAASPNPVLGWVGSLSAFEGTKGYWAKVEAAFDFSFDLSNSSGREVVESYSYSPYEFTQSTQQAFYFIESIDADIQEGDWILAYNDNVLVGSRQWSGSYTDIPTMGYDDAYTSGYCEVGDIPKFVWVDSSGEQRVLIGDIPSWSNNEIYNLTLEEDTSNTTPSTYTLIQNYPNPFNPTTSISFTTPSQDYISINVYDLSGRLVATLLNENLEKGSYSVTWDGKDMSGLNVSSGVYIYTLEGNGISLQNKMMLIK